MAQQMGWEGAGLYEYHYERGLYYHEIAPGLFCGTMPRNISDLVRLCACCRPASDSSVFAPLVGHPDFCLQDYLHFHEGIKTVLNVSEHAQRVRTRLMSFQ